MFRNRAQEGRKGRGWGGKRRCLPASFVVNHGVENNEKLAHAGDERGLGVLPIGTQPQIESSDGGIRFGHYLEPFWPSPASSVAVLPVRIDSIS